ncbi:alpha/beta hydrolase [Streptomyces monashensis]|uniref:alpha/beta fold hydrolase n=1 Tax=Streptomyces monashensis TaxID=1678012 RepID=UPI003400B506
MSFASPAERYVTREGVDLAVHDHGGDGPPLLLLHGAGRTLADWAAVAPLLTPRHRVIAMDLRAHGRSGGGAWTFPAVLADVAAVLDALAVPHAVPVGHSLGGMVAVRYALDHPETPAAVNLDGHGYGRPEQYVGLDPEYVGRRLEEIRGFAARAAGRVLPGPDMAAVLGGQRAMAEGLGIPRDLFDEGLRRSLAEREDGMRWLRPEREPALQMLAAMDELDLFPLYRRTRSPLLICRAARPNPPTPGLPWFDELMSAYAEGLNRDLRELARTQPHVTVEDIDATHAMLLERPGDVAARILSFAARTAPSF